MEYKLDILVVQEMHWTEKRVVDKRNCNVYYSCHDRIHHFGSDFIVGKRIQSKVIEFISVNERICRLHIKGIMHNISIICAHTSRRTKEMKLKVIFMIILKKPANTSQMA